MRFRRPLFLVAPFVLFSLAVGLVGCSSTSYVIYPTSQQGQSVNQVVRSGYTFLRSEKGGHVATVSLRRATESYVQTYVSISNKGDTPIAIDPEAVTVQVADGSQSFSAYNPTAVPGVVRSAAEGSRKSFVGMNSASVTGSTAMGGEKVTGGSRGTYDSSSESEGSYIDLMLEKQTLSGQQATSGLVFTPFSEGIQDFKVLVPIGGTTHTFQFTVRKAENQG